MTKYIIIVVVSIALYLTNNGKHTALYKINKMYTQHFINNIWILYSLHTAPVLSHTHTVVHRKIKEEKVLISSSLDMSWIIFWKCNRVAAKKPKVDSEILYKERWRKHIYKGKNFVASPESNTFFRSTTSCTNTIPMHWPCWRQRGIPQALHLGLQGFCEKIWNQTQTNMQ